ncbi:MAG: exo-alpha-sialidase [Armatimonadetes bacterium]|nr:exo-alpha-sialidase [Armatimonadota bacterium]
MIALALICMVAQDPLPKAYAIPVVDLDRLPQFHVVVDQEKGQYLGHPTTVLLEDGKTILTVYPKAHGRGPIVYKRSADGGKTWSERLPTPENWATSKETPTIHRVIDPKTGKKRLIVWSGLYPARMAVSEDAGESWSPLESVGDWGGIVVMGFTERMKNGDYLAMFHDDGRFFKEGGKQTPTMTLYKTFSKDGGMTWSEPEAVHAASDVHLCEPGFIRSPDGKTIAILLRENTRTRNSYVMFSRNEGKTWTNPRELPAALTGDRHTAKYGPDGRLFISFRDTTHISPTRWDWAGWVGTWEDIVMGREGQYRVRLKKNYVGADCGYPGVEILPDGTFVTTTYGHWDEGEVAYIRTVRFKLADLDRILKEGRHVIRPGER